MSRANWINQSSVSTTITVPTPTWAQVLASGNTSGANNAIMNTGQTLLFAGGISIGSNGVAPSGSSGISVGANSLSSVSTAMAVGGNATASNTQSSALGYNATVSYNYSTGVGAGSTPTKASQVMLGTATEVVTVPADLEIGHVEYEFNYTGTTTAAAAVNVTSVTLLAGSCDGAGQVAIVVPAANPFSCTVTFANAVGGTNIIVLLTPTTDNSYHAGEMFVSGISGAGFTIEGNAGTFGAATYYANYKVIGLL